MRLVIAVLLWMSGCERAAPPIEAAAIPWRPLRVGERIEVIHDRRFTIGTSTQQQIDHVRLTVLAVEQDQVTKLQIDVLRSDFTDLASPDKRHSFLRGSYEVSSREGLLEVAPSDTASKRDRITRLASGWMEPSNLTRKLVSRRFRIGQRVSMPADETLALGFQGPGRLELELELVDATAPTLEFVVKGVQATTETVSKVRKLQFAGRLAFATDGRSGRARIDVDELGDEGKLVEAQVIRAWHFVPN